MKKNKPDIVNYDRLLEEIDELEKYFATRKLKRGDITTITVKFIEKMHFIDATGFSK